VTPFRSDPELSSRARLVRRLAISALALTAVFAVVAPALASVVTTDRFIVRAEDSFDEDVYVAAQSARVEGTINGDLVIATGGLVITGTVTGDVYALASGRVSVEADGRIGGSLRGVARDVVVIGTVEDDVAVAALTTSIDGGPGLEVGRDVVVFGGSLSHSGDVGRDIRGRMVNASVNGTVGRDLDVTLERLVIEGSAEIGGDVLYRSGRSAAISPDAMIAGQVVQLPAQSNFIFGVILTIANLVGFLGFLVLGIFVLWLFRTTSSTAVGAVITHPFRTLLIGLIAVVVAPLLVLLLAVSLVGLPLAATVLLGILVLLVAGPVPALTAFGDRVLRGRAGLFGGFLLGAALWRLGIWLIPIVGGVVYLIGLVWGTGGWVYGGWMVRFAPRRREPTPRDDGADAKRVGDVPSAQDEAPRSFPPDDAIPDVPPPGASAETDPADSAGRPEPAPEPAEPRGSEGDESGERDEWGLPPPG
jgi:cytoskeletal protein CcmA (bactofilin family)